MDSKSSDNLTETKRSTSSNTKSNTNEYVDHVYVHDSDKEDYTDMSCSFQTNDKQEYGDNYEFSDTIYAIISTGEKVDEAECTNDSISDSSEVYTSMEVTEDISSHKAEAGGIKEKVFAQKDVILASLKKRWNRKTLLLWIAIGVFLLAVVICFISAFAEISKLKMSRSASTTQSELTAPELQELITSLEQHNISLRELLANLGSPGQFSTHPVENCSTLPPSSLPGYYWVRDSVGSSVRVYCDISFSCKGVTGGWMRVAELDMTNSSHQCPSGFMQRTESDTRTCVRNTDSPGCSSITYSTANIHYSRVCGRVIGYQVGATNAFKNQSSISSFYVDGVSLTHGTTYEHIWTFAAAQSESANSETASSSCSCITAGASESLPSFVGMDYFCDTGVSGAPEDDRLYANDPLWDGAGCEPPNTCCSFNTPPWFDKQLPQLTTDDIEMRVCTDESLRYENIAIEIVELYIQ